MTQPNSLFPSIDNERSDIALARDIAQGVARDNAAKEFHRELPSYEWGDITNQSIVGLVMTLIENGNSQYLGYKSDIYWPDDIETISEAVTEACIQLGLSDENFSPNLNIDGYEFEITL